MGMLKFSTNVPGRSEKIMTDNQEPGY